MWLLNSRTLQDLSNPGTVQMQVNTVRHSRVTLTKTTAMICHHRRRMSWAGDSLAADWPLVHQVYPCFPMAANTCDMQNCNKLFLFSYKYKRGTGIRGLMRGMATLPQGNQEPLVVTDKVGRPRMSLGVSKS